MVYSDFHSSPKISDTSYIIKDFSMVYLGFYINSFEIRAIFWGRKTPDGKWVKTLLISGIYTLSQSLADLYF